MKPGYVVSKNVLEKNHRNSPSSFKAKNNDKPSVKFDTLQGTLDLSSSNLNNQQYSEGNILQKQNSAKLLQPAQQVLKENVNFLSNRSLIKKTAINTGQIDIKEDTDLELEEYV